MSLRKAADAMCKNCIYDKSEPGTWRDQVEGCKCTDCPLFAYRPMTMATINARRAAKGEAPATEEADADNELEVA